LVIFGDKPVYNYINEKIFSRALGIDVVFHRGTLNITKLRASAVLPSHLKQVLVFTESYNIQDKEF